MTRKGTAIRNIRSPLGFATFVVRIPEALRASVGVRLATIRVLTGKRLSLSGLIEDLLGAWLQMPFEENLDAIEEAVERVESIK